MKNNADISKLTIHPPASVFLVLAMVILLAVDMGHQVSLGQSLGVGASELTEPGKAFKEYEADAPPIQHIVFEQSYAVGKYGPGVFWGDGAIQSGGYFIRHLTNSPYTKGILVDGVSSNAEWEYFPENKAISYGPRTFWTNFSTSSIFPGLLTLQTVARLGLPRPFPDHDAFVWTSQTNFRFHGPYDNYAGHIVKFDDRDRPIELEYHSAQKDAKNSTTCLLFYKYDAEQNFPPSQFVVDCKIGDSHSLTTNTIHSLAIGTDEHAERGYSLQEFLPSTAAIGSVFYLSNNVRYIVQPDGSKVEYKYSDPVEHSLRPAHHAIIFVFLAVFILAVAYLVRRRWSV